MQLTFSEGRGPKWHDIIQYQNQQAQTIHDTLQKYFSCRPHSGAMESQIAKFMGPSWGPPGSCRPQMGHMLAPWNLLSWVLFVSRTLDVNTTKWRVHLFPSARMFTKPFTYKLRIITLFSGHRFLLLRQRDPEYITKYHLMWSNFGRCKHENYFTLNVTGTSDTESNGTVNRILLTKIFNSHRNDNSWRMIRKNKTTPSKNKTKQNKTKQN